MHWPLLLASLPIVAILAVPMIAALLLLLPAAVPLLAIAPIFVLASTLWIYNSIQIDTFFNGLLHLWVNYE